MAAPLPLIGWGLAAGEGRRLFPLTQIEGGGFRSKAMVSFLGRPILAWQLEAFAAGGLARCYLVTRGEFNREPVRAWFGHHFAAVDLAYSEAIWDRCDTGSADATLRHAARLGVTQPILVFPTDSLFAVDLRALWRFHRLHRADFTLATMPLPADRIDGRYGTVLADARGRVTGFWEKPTAAELVGWGSPPGPKGWPINIGLYVISPNLLRQLDRHPEVRAMRRRRLDFGLDLLPWLVARGFRVYAFSGARAGDLGNREAFLETMGEVLAGRFPLTPPTPPHGWAHIAPRIHPTASVRGSWVAPDVVIGPGARVEGSYLGEGVVVGSEAVVEGAHIAADSFIGAAAEVRSSIVGTAVRIHSRRPHPTVVERGSALGDGAEVLAGARLVGAVLAPGAVASPEPPVQEVSASA